MTIKYFYIIAIYLFLGCSDSNSKDSNINIYSDLKSELDYLYFERDVFQDFKIKEWKSAFSKINNASLESIGGKKVALKEILENDYTFIFHFTTRCCPPCVDQYLNLCNSIYEQILDSTSIYIISNYSTIRQMKTKIIEFNIKP